RPKRAGHPAAPPGAIAAAHERRPGAGAGQVCAGSQAPDQRAADDPRHTLSASPGERSETRGPWALAGCSWSDAWPSSMDRADEKGVTPTGTPRASPFLVIALPASLDPGSRLRLA